MAAPPFPGPGTNNRMVQKIELRISCRNLANKDTTSKSDPCAVLYFQHGNKYKEFARTENVKNNLDPDFSTPFAVEYHFECVQNVRIRIYDVDNSTAELSDDDFLGQIETNLARIVSKSPYNEPLKKKKDSEKLTHGTITITAEEIKEGTELALMTFKAKKLENKDFMGKSDPFMEISRMTDNGSWLLVHRTEVVKNDLSPHWRPFHLHVSSMCGNDKLKPIMFAIFDWDGDGDHDLIGGFTTTLDELSKATSAEVSWPCINDAKKQKKKNYKDSGTVTLSTLKFQKQYSFLDYIFGGLQMNLTIGVDFTASNGFPTDPRSLHFFNPHEPNEYMKAISAVGNVLQDYDTDKLFPALGFGAQLPQTSQVSFEFPLNFNFGNPFCAGIQGVLDAYVNCISQIQLYGPTNVSPIINHVARFAHAAQQNETEIGAGSYYILLLLTDGVLSDMDEAKNALVAASSLPMSIIIVGVGQADFDDMHELDGDDGVLKSTSGLPAKRDIVQFVPFRQFKMSHPAELASHVLAEIPSQVTNYFRMRGLAPRSQAPQQPPVQ